jgi:HEPN domain-containing protein
VLTLHELIVIRHLIRKVYDKQHEQQIVQIVDKIEKEIIKARTTDRRPTGELSET